MKWRKWLEDWEMSSLKINTLFLEMEWSPSGQDGDAAWELYIELLTRVATQKLETVRGGELSALQSIYSLFPITRKIIRSKGRDCSEFTKLAIVILNQKIRPFTTKWHQTLTDESLLSEEVSSEFRQDLEELQVTLEIYSGMLSEMAGVEDLTNLEV